MSPELTPIKKCRGCGNSELIPCVDIGEQYFSSIFPETLDYRTRLKKYPLAMMLCKTDSSQKNCGLVQLAFDLNLSEMYQAYPYTSSSNSSMRQILKDVAQSGVALDHLNPGDLILDIGCNDGTLLSFFKEAPYLLLGIDAAQNVQPVFESPQFQLVRGFFNRKTFNAASPLKSKLIFSIAMFYHLNDPLQFCRDVEACLADDGAWIIQMAYLPAMLETNMYDNIVHEHAGYYGIQTMEWILDRAGLEIFDVVLNEVYGGSFRLFVKKKGYSGFQKTKRYHDLLQREKQAAIFDIQTFESFQLRLLKTREDLIQKVKQIRSEGKTIWVYGASTKGNTIMQYCGLTSGDIDAAADSNPFKFGKYMIGCDIPIKPEEEMRSARPDYLLALPYSFVAGFLQREENLIRNGTRFIVPLPNVTLLP